MAAAARRGLRRGDLAGRSSPGTGVDHAGPWWKSSRTRDGGVEDEGRGHEGRGSSETVPAGPLVEPA
ncbi:MAG: hypothetical protein AVDCRST_MAG19-2191 [uncultured Thermomicrobiales bacterium]|uniref:Uncharacterized protein n=1 Tax=uncultured Thermomicrobiales bacterium TaxID=1645740 RepID=A0A6J4V303_9BACT|nr:MAG: hypothetical protein AVDCRST_MAG19-2191 [uncultured Thermomicrobiales bacterium]